MEQPGAALRGRAAPCLPSWERGMEEWGGKEKITGEEQGSSIQRISTSLLERGASPWFVWVWVLGWFWGSFFFFFSNEKGEF